MSNTETVMECESGAQAMARIRRRPPSVTTNRFFPFGLTNGDSVLIRGEPSVGKSYILCSLVCDVICPKATGGNESSAILFDCGMTVNPVIVILNIIAYRIKKHNLQGDESLLPGTLKRLKVVRAYNSEKLAITFLQMDDLLLREDFSDVTAIFVDSITSFYKDESVRSPKLSEERYMMYWITIIDNIVKKHGLYGVYVKQGLSTNAKADDPLKYILQVYDGNFEIIHSQGRVYEDFSIDTDGVHIPED